MCEYSEINNSISNFTCFYDLTQEQEKIHCTIFNFNLYARLLVCGIGLFLNSVTIALFFDKTLACVFFNRLLLCLAIVDNIYLIVTIVEDCIFSHRATSFDHRYIFYFFLYPTRNITLCCTTYITVILAWERYNAVKSQPNPETMRDVSWTRVVKYILPVVLFCIMFKMSNFFEFEIEKATDDGIQLPFNTSVVLAKHISLNKGHNVTTRIIVSDMRSDKLYVLLYMNITNLILTGIVPFALLAFLNFHVYRGVVRFHIRRASIRSQRADRHPANYQEANDNAQSTILVAIVLLFFLCNILRIVLNVEDWISHTTRFEELGAKDCKYGVPYWALLTAPISETLLRVNSSINFIIYCAFNNHFRNVISNQASKISNTCGILKFPTSDPVTNRFENLELQIPQSEIRKTSETTETLI